MNKIQNMRQEYQQGVLEEHSLPSHPLDLFQKWFSDAQHHPNLKEPNAMALSTINPDGGIHSRMVLLKGYDHHGFCFFTNSTSRKGQEIAQDPQAALLFHWEALERQIQITGEAQLLPRQETAAYFKTRPRGSRIGAWASFQSQPLSSRAPLENRLHELEERFKDQEIPLPDFWNGYRVIPATIEFWQGRPNRLHDRILYKKEKEENLWSKQRLSP